MVHVNCWQTVHDAELDLEVAKLDMEKARDKLAKTRLMLREQTTGEGERNQFSSIQSLDQVSHWGDMRDDSGEILLQFFFLRETVVSSSCNDTHCF